jgi:hypothetical protein
MKKIIITVNKNGACDAYSLYVVLKSESEKMTLIKAGAALQSEKGYNIKIEKSPYELPNPVSYKEALMWLKKVVLHKQEYILDKVSVEVIHLPEGLKFNSMGYLEVDKIVDWEHPKHEDCLREIELSKWVLEKFPSSTFVGSRARFTLPSTQEEFYNSRKTTMWIYSVSASGNRAIEVTKRSYKKVITEI